MTPTLHKTLPLFALLGLLMADSAVADLAPCPDSPNCVSSLAEDEGHFTPPLAYQGEVEKVWLAAKEAILAQPRTVIVEERPGYLRAEATSRIFRWVDDLELALEEETAQIHVRSASRTGYGDLGVNRKRVEALRSALTSAGVLRE